MTARPKRSLIMGVRYNTPLHANALPGGLLPFGLRPL